MLTATRLQVAQDRQMLLENGIARVLNCAGTVLPCHHRWKLRRPGRTLTPDNIDQAGGGGGGGCERGCEREECACEC